MKGQGGQGGHFLTTIEIKQITNKDIKQGDHFLLPSELKQIREINKGAGLKTMRLKQTR